MFVFVFGNKHNLCLSLLQIGFVTVVFYKLLTINDVSKAQK